MLRAGSFGWVNCGKSGEATLDPSQSCGFTAKPAARSIFVHSSQGLNRTAVQAACFYLNLPSIRLCILWSVRNNINKRTTTIHKRKDKTQLVSYGIQSGVIKVLWCQIAADSDMSVFKRSKEDLSKQQLLHNIIFKLKECFHLNTNCVFWFFSAISFGIFLIMVYIYEED